MSTAPSPPDAEPGALGGYFAFDTHPPGSPTPDPWRPMRELVDASGALSDRIAATRTALAAASGTDVDAVETRVAASIAHLGLSARLLAPVIGAAVLTGRVIDIDLAQVWWQPVLGGPFPLSLPSPAGAAPAARDHLATRIAARVLDGPISELVEAAHALSVSRQILWGNIASAINGAAAMVARARPQSADRARDLATALFEQTPLRHTSITDTDGRFRRLSCCLIYRADPSGPVRSICQDCILQLGQERDRSARRDGDDAVH